MVSTWFRHSDSRFPFFWEATEQTAARWHGQDEGPAQYLADTPDGAWAEFLRHERIADAADIVGIDRSLWAIAVDEERETVATPALPSALLRGSLDTYPNCRAEARRLREGGATALEAPSAALVDGAARGQRTEGGLVEGEDRDGRVLVLFGPRSALRGWRCTSGGSVHERILPLVRPL